MKFDLKKIAEASVMLLKVFSIYLLVTWFFGVGLASMITLSKIFPETSTYQIGAVTGIITITLPILIISYWVLNEKLKKMDVKK